MVLIIEIVYFLRVFVVLFGGNGSKIRFEVEIIFLSSFWYLNIIGILWVAIGGGIHVVVEDIVGIYILSSLEFLIVV